MTGRVHGWDGGESLGTLGDVVRMGSVALLPDHRDHYLVLFPTVLVMLAVSPRMSAFIFEVQLLRSHLLCFCFCFVVQYYNFFQVSKLSLVERMPYGGNSFRALNNN